MERNKLVLTSDSLRNLVYEEYLVIDRVEIPVKHIKTEYVESGRHQEYHSLIFQTTENGKFYDIGYSESTQDTMGWEECNYGPFEAIEVFPHETTVITYK